MLFIIPVMRRGQGPKQGPKPGPWRWGVVVHWPKSGRNQLRNPHRSDSGIITITEYSDGLHMCAFDYLAFNAWLYAFTNCIAFVRLTLVVEALRVSHEDSASRRRRDTVVLKFLGGAGTAFPIDLNLQVNMDYHMLICLSLPHSQ